MPNIKSAEKRVKISEKKRLYNKQIKSKLRTFIKKFLASLTGENTEQSKQDLKAASRALDKAASKGVIHKNTAARKKARLAKSLHKKTANE